jgi:hypothetical protein
MHVIFIITGLVSFLYVAGGLQGLAHGEGRAEMWATRMCLGLVGLLMSASWFFLYNYICRLRKQLDELNQTVRHLQAQARKLPPR